MAVDRRFTETLQMALGASESPAWQLLVDDALEAFVAVDESGVILEFNRAAARLFGREREDAVGRGLGEVLVPPRLRSGHRARLERAVGPGRAELVGRRIEMPAVRGDGTELRVEYVVIQLTDSPPCSEPSCTTSRNPGGCARPCTTVP